MGRGNGQSRGRANLGKTATIAKRNGILTYDDDGNPKNGFEVSENETTRWFKDGLLHREDGPAVKTKDGAERWYQNGKLHREDGPAIVSEKEQVWALNGRFHRGDDKPAVLREDKTQAWFIDGYRHRENGPAVIKADGTKEWYVRGRQISPRSINK